MTDKQLRAHEKCLERLNQALKHLNDINSHEDKEVPESSINSDLLADARELVTAAILKLQNIKA